ncbi:hypothetical protein [Aureispira anguillae]|uniref:Uncharacterized protein n=1 Tax=Aureispira anguillae TaxID=2864201 RepID=A0A915YIH0_9BACT|nr:hypothetical protein [Aureispira anguillae]BDS13612.1 hypothetical protein AsAng_0043510 [Aureispira anguillae]
MNKLKCLLLLLGVISIGACRPDKTSYELHDLEGDWRRTWSTDYRSDSMIVRILPKSDSAFITFSPTSSDFTNGQVKWEGIHPTVGDIHFQLYDLSADSTPLKANIVLKSATKLELNSVDYPDAPGGVQEWEKI